MEKSKPCERQEISSWSCCDVNDLYENITKVGSGTYGEVTKARLKSNPSQIVALKKIKDASETEGFPITALREINILQQCTHPNIVKLLNVVASKSKNQTYRDNKSYTYLVFEYMDHELLGYIEMCTFNPSQVKCILKQILEGLAYLHSNNIVHRDIKSANILVNNRGEVKIADFGLSKAMNPNLSGKLTQRVVTRWYRAPELLLGSKKYTDKIDIWALGCVFAELLVGRSQALFPAQKTPDQFELICEKCGTPDEGQWPEYKSLPFYNKMAPRRNYNRVLTQFMCRQRANMDPFALDLLEKMLCFNPNDRITAKEALSHPYFQSFPLPCAPYELPKIDQDCHTFIINNKRKNNYTENNYKHNQPYVNQKLSYKNRNMQPQPQPQKMNVYNAHQINPQPPLCQYNNYCNCNQYTHIENVNNINVNLFLPAQNPLMSQVNFYPSNFPQQVPSFNPPMTFEGLNNNFFIPQNIQNSQSQINPINPMDLGVVWKATVPAPNQNIIPELNQYPTTCSNRYQQQPSQYSNQFNKYQYQQDPNLYNIPTLRKDQISNFEKPYFQVQEQLMRGNSQTLKRRPTNNIEEFEMMQKKHQQQFFGFYTTK